MPANWSSTSNANPTPADIPAPIAAYFVYVPDGAALPTDVPSAAKGNICLVDSKQTPGPTLFAQMAANCEAGGGLALLIFNAGAVSAPSHIPVFSMSGTDGTFLKDTVGSDAGTKVSNYPIRINTAPPATNLTGHHNCPSQASPPYLALGTPT